MMAEGLQPPADPADQCAAGCVSDGTAPERLIPCCAGARPHRMHVACVQAYVRARYRHADQLTCPLCRDPMLGELLAAYQALPFQPARPSSEPVPDLDSSDSDDGRSGPSRSSTGFLSTGDEFEDSRSNGIGGNNSFTNCRFVFNNH